MSNTALIAEAKKAIDDIHPAMNALRERLDKIEVNEEKGYGVAELKTQVEKIESFLDPIEEKLEELNASINRPGSQFEKDEQKDADDRYREIYAKKLRGEFFKKAGASVPSKYNLTDAERKEERAYYESKDWSVGDADNNTGGHLVPVGMADRIRTLMRDSSPVRNWATVVDTALLERPFLIENADSVDLAVVSETGGGSVTATGTIEEVNIKVHIIDAQPVITLQLLEDSALDIEEFVATHTARKLSRTFNQKYVAGAGGSSDLQGFLTAGGAVGSITVVQETSAVNVLNENIGFDADDVIEMIFDLDDDYADNISICARRQTYAAMRKFKDTQGQYLWQVSLQAGMPTEFLGVPTWRAQDMPNLGLNPADDLDALVIGDFMQGYGIVDRPDARRVLVDEITDKNLIKFHTRERGGGGVLDARALRILRTFSVT